MYFVGSDENFPGNLKNSKVIHVSRVIMNEVFFAYGIGYCPGNDHSGGVRLHGSGWYKTQCSACSHTHSVGWSWCGIHCTYVHGMLYMLRLNLLEVKRENKDLTLGIKILTT